MCTTNDKTDLLKRQIETWENIPVRLQQLILKGVCERIRELLRQNNRQEEEDTTGYEDDLEALEAELKEREARRKPPRRSAGEPRRAMETREEPDVQTLENEPDAGQAAPSGEVASGARMEGVIGEMPRVGVEISATNLLDAPDTQDAPDPQDAQNEEQSGQDVDMVESVP